MKKTLALIIGSFVVAAGALAQVESGSQAEQEPVPVVSSPRQTNLKGDVIRFKSGTVLSSVQVIRQTSNALEVQVLPELPPLRIPLDLVADVEYDDIEPIRGRRQEQQQVPQRTAVATELSTELNDKLQAPLPPELLAASGDVVEVLTAIATEMEVPIEFEEEVRTLEPRALSWKEPLPPNTSLFTLLQDHLKRELPALRVHLKFDKITIGKHEADGADASPGAPEEAGAASPLAE